MSDIISLIEDTVELCSQQWNSVTHTLEFVDRTVLLLQISSSVIDDLISSVNDANTLMLTRELQVVLTQLVVQWETMLMHLERQSLRNCGRPKIVINIEMVEFLREMGYTWSKCAETLLVSRTTLWRRAKELGILSRSHTVITDNDLDAVVRIIHQQSPNSGTVIVWGHLKSQEVYVPRRRVRESLIRICPEAVEIRASRAVRRRVYNVPSSNALWHIDGLHCLIRWRIVIHGCIDGFSRKITYLHASNNNRASTVLELFLGATEEHGWPLRVRSDKGGENIDVARAMLIMRGTGRSSHIAGASVHNQRIERLWRDTFRCVCHFFYALFYDMEDSGILSATDEVQLFCLHYVFLPRLNRQLRQFVYGWNHHHLRSEHGLTPNMLWLRGLGDCAFDAEIQADYGIQDGRPNPFDMGRVEVPRMAINLTDQQLQSLQARYDPLCNSEYSGFDTFIDTYDFVKNIL